MDCGQRRRFIVYDELVFMMVIIYDELVGAILLTNVAAISILVLQHKIVIDINNLVTDSRWKKRTFTS